MQISKKTIRAAEHVEGTKLALHIYRRTYLLLERRIATWNPMYQSYCTSRQCIRLNDVRGVVRSCLAARQSNG